MSLARTVFLRVLAAAGMAALLPLPCAAAAPGQIAAAGVTSRLEAQDCAGAVEELKAGLKKNYAEVSLLAGSMYDHGICVPHDWDRAVLFYSQAYQAGMKEAADRLAAGFAAPENGADVAAALWWAGQGRMQGGGSQVLAPCVVSPAAAQDIDRFVGELKTWPQSKLAMCNYVAGVMATLSAETKYPGRARAYGVGGEVVLRFLPAVPRIEMKTAGSHEYQLLGVVDGDTLRERGSTRVTGSFEQMLGAVADRALARYPQPQGIPADAEFALRFIFELE